MKKENIFIYTVCGADKHIQRLNFSLKYLRHFSNNRIIVVTDLSRNNLQIQHKDIIDVKTPPNLDHHQASIFLKTSLHKILDVQHDYCYLDSDVIAIREGVDNIFNHQYGLIAFGSDSINISEFSPYAMKCGCLKKYQSSIESIQLLLDHHYKYTLTDPKLIKSKQKLDKAIEKFKNNKLKDPVLIERRKKLNQIVKEFENYKLKDPILIERGKKLNQIIKEFENNKLKDPILIEKKRKIDKLISEFDDHKDKLYWKYLPWRYLPKKIQRIFIKQPYYNFDEFFEINGNFHWDENKRQWSDGNGNIIYDDILHNFNKFFEMNGGFHWNENEKKWYDHEGNILFDDMLHNSGKFFEINGGFHWNENEKKWYDRKGNILFDEKSYYRAVDYIEKHTEFRLDRTNQSWMDLRGKKVYDNKCTHLLDAIYHSFSVKIEDKNWVQWNGGVFLFNKSSIEFMDNWHQYTMEIFDDSNWVTRDQGTLIATVWELSLQHQKRLPIEYNFIIDYHNKDLVYHEKLNFSAKRNHKVIAPFLVHIFHEFGRKDWKIWQDIEKLL